MIKFLIESSSDYDVKEAKEKGIEHVSIPITIGEKTFYDDGSVTKDEFYQMTQESEEFPKTSQPSPQEFVEVFEKVKEAGDELICVLLSSGLSGTVQSAALAKDMVDYDNIYIVDSLTATYAIKVLVDYGMELRDNGKTAQEIADILDEMKSRVKIYAVLDTLENLYRGGRLSKLEAGIGSLAKIKPLITITEDGKIGVKAKSIGKKKALNDIEKLITSENIDESFPIYSLYSLGTENNEAFTGQLNEQGVEFTDRFQIGPTIGTHIGPGAYGIIFVRKD